MITMCFVEGPTKWKGITNHSAETIVVNCSDPRAFVAVNKVTQLHVLFCFYATTSIFLQGEKFMLTVAIQVTSGATLSPDNHMIFKL